MPPGIDCASCRLSREVLHDCQPGRGGVSMLVCLVVASVCLLSAVLALALLREVRLRRALEALLRRILNTWRQFHAAKKTGPARRAANDPHDDRDGRL